MQEHPSTNGNAGHTNEQVHAEQRALVHYAVLHPGDHDARYRPQHTTVHDRRYALNGRAMQAIREQVQLEVYSELDAHAGLTIEHIAHFAAMAAEHAIQHIGVERTP